MSDHDILSNHDIFVPTLYFHSSRPFMAIIFCPVKKDYILFKFDLNMIENVINRLLTTYFKMVYPLFISLLICIRHTFSQIPLIFFFFWHNAQLLLCCIYAKFKVWNHIFNHLINLWLTQRTKGGRKLKASLFCMLSVILLYTSSII